ncbi:MAG TPA: hypothetical protein VF178_10495 [Gemmatimonadaceae bacterium]
MVRRSAAVSLFALIGTVAAAQDVPTTRLTNPAAEFPEGFSQLSAMRELRDGRVLVVEQCERLLKVADFKSGTLSQVGRTGSGPGEYRSPSRLLALAGDSSAIYDPSNSRFLVIRADGTPGGFFEAIPGVTETRGNVVMFSARFSPTASDAQGWLYARESGIKPGASGMVTTDSVAIERWDPVTKRRDTVAVHNLRLPAHELKPGESDPPFTTGIQWAVAPDGRVALVHPSDYHVEYVNPNGTRTKGAPIRYTRVRVSQEHREAFLEQRRRPACPLPANVRMMVGDDPTEWPDYLPPFLSGAARFASDGILWVLRTGPADGPPTYDLIDGAGRLVHRVILPPRAKLLGFGKGSVYIVKLDDDDLQFLQRHPLPAVPRG